MNVEGYRDKLEAVSLRISVIGAKIGEIVAERADVLLSLNKDQMLLGRDTAGEPFTPSYLDDPYFKTPAQAQAYAAMKKGLEAQHKARIENPLNYPDKAPNTPNLIVTGPFQNNMYITTDREKYMISSHYDETPAIVTKYNGKVFGLAPLSKEYFWKSYLFIDLKQHIYGV